jgi:hypothetical protein
MCRGDCGREAMVGCSISRILNDDQSGIFGRVRCADDASFLCDPGRGQNYFLRIYSRIAVECFPSARISAHGRRVEESRLLRGRGRPETARLVRSRANELRSRV